MTVENPKPKQLLRPIKTGADSAMNRSQFLAIICKRGKDHLYIWCDWFRKTDATLKQITKRSNRNHVITFDSHLKNAL